MPSSRAERPVAIVVMGVSGCGKSSVGEQLAAGYGVHFIEGDRLHPAANVEKMAQGIPLTDADRLPWLDAVGAEIRTSLRQGEGAVFSCSALKKAYRDRLRAAAGGNLAFVYLEGSPDLLKKRMAARQGHFMPVSLLEDQLRTLEVPTGEKGVVTVDIDDTIDGIAARAEAALEGLAW